MKDFLKNDRYQPYVFSIMIGIILLIIEILMDFNIPKVENITGLSNIFITVISIFVGFLGVGLTLIYQGKENPNILMLKANNKYNLFIGYFKQAIVFSLLAIIFGVFVSLGIWVKWYIFLILIVLNILVLLLNYRIIHFLFKILEE